MVFPLLLTVLLTAASAPDALLPHPTDSVGVKVQGGKTYIKYQIKKGDTFYSIARQYSLVMAQVVAANPKVNSALRIGQVVLVPRATAVLTVEPPRSAPTARAPEKSAPGPTVLADPPAGVRRPARTHTVKQGETLSGIARKNHTSIARLRELNHLKSDALRLKQVLVVEAATAGPRAAAGAHPTEKAPADAPKEATADQPAAPAPRHEEIDKPAAPPATTADAPHRAPGADAADDTTAGTEVAESLRKVTESGMAETIDQSGESNKYLALHRAAPVGTILQVKNPQNGQSVYVRVIGKLPPTGANENVIIRLSRRAVQKLAVVDARFRVEVSYMP